LVNEMYKEPAQKIELLKKLADRTINQVHDKHNSEDVVGRDKIKERAGKIQRKLNEIGGTEAPKEENEVKEEKNEITVPIKGNVQS